MLQGCEPLCLHPVDAKRLSAEHPLAGPSLATDAHYSNFIP